MRRPLIDVRDFPAYSCRESVLQILIGIWELPFNADSEWLSIDYY